MSHLILDFKTEDNNDPYFNLIAEALYHIFTKYKWHNSEQIIDNINSLKSSLISSWCDCSDNFSQDVLIINYQNLLTNREKKLI